MQFKDRLFALAISNKKTQVQDVCKNFKPFSVSLDYPKYFDGSILYLSVHSDHLYNLHKKLVEAISPSKELINQYFELDAFVPQFNIRKSTVSRKHFYMSIKK